MLAAGWSTQEEITGYAGDTGEAFANQMLRWSQGLGNQDMIREACLRSGEAVDWMMDTGRTYEGASPLPPVWSWRRHGGRCRAALGVQPQCHYGATEGHMATLKKRAESLSNIEIEMGCEVAHILKNAEGSVIGVQLADGSFAKARKGVVMACASVDNNLEMSKDLGLMQNVWGLTLEGAGLLAPGNPDYGLEYR